MDSSDSEDDCYGNIAQKLQSMKNKYTEDKIESTNLLNDSVELDKIVKKANIDVKNTTEAVVVNVNYDNVIGTENSDEVFIDNIIASSSKRMTRSAAKRHSVDVSITECTIPTKFKRRKTKDTPPVTASENGRRGTNTGNTPNNNSNTTRGRSRGRKRNRPVYNPSTHYPTFSVGNTDEYPDQSDNQILFSKPKTDDIVVIEENDLDENEELSVKVYWQSSEFFKFTIRRFQKLKQIFDYFSKKENVSHDKLLLTYNDKILKADDTPDTINYNIVKFIDGGIVNQSVTNLVKDKSKGNVTNGILLKFQYQNVKKPVELNVGLDEKFSIAMMKCAEHLETALDKLKFEFDGDVISGKSTARELDLEGGECIDVKVMR